MEIYTEVETLCKNAKKAARELALASETRKNALLTKLAELLRDEKRYAAIIEANKKDLDCAGENGVPAAMLDRLMINEKRIE